MSSPASVSLPVETKNSILTQALFMGLFAFLTAVGAQIEIPHQPVPYTLQTFFVLLAGAFLGKRNGAISQAAYLVAGSIGLPVFSGFGFGLARILGPTGGYLFGFPIAAFVVGYLTNGTHSYVRILAAMAAGLFVIFSLGTLQLNFLVYHDWTVSVTNGFLIFSWWDVLKVTAAAAVVRQLSGKISSLRS